MYYKARDEEGVPTDWVRRMKQSLMHLSPQFNAQRMVAEYVSQLYDPAHNAYLEARENHYQASRERVRWNEQVSRAWDRIRIVEAGSGPEGAVLSGRPIPMRAVVELSGLSPNEVRVEAVIGRVGVNGELEDTQILTLPPVEQHGGAYLFAKEFVPYQTGRLGYSLRVSPNHYDNPLTRPCNSLLKWSPD